MDDELILTIDFGTQSVRVSAFDKMGSCLAMEKEAYDPPYFSTHPNFAEQDPDLYFRTLCSVSKRFCGKHAGLFARIKGACLTCFRDSAVILDCNQKVIRPMILWLDQRMAKCDKPLPLLSRMAFRLVGMTDTINFNRKRSVANWLIENEPENWERVDKYLPISTYLIYRLTGLMRDSSSNMAGHYPIDFKKRQWYKNPEKHLKGQIFSVRKSMLPEIVPEGSPIGAISEEASRLTGLPQGLVLYACGSDKSCETLGLGVTNDKTAAISYGTASTVETTTKKYIESEPFLPGYPSCVPGFYNMDIQIYRGYWMIGWFLKEFGGKEPGDVMMTSITPQEFNDKLKEVPPGSNGLVLQPYWGPGLSRPLAKGAVIGFSDSTTQEHFYRAIIEGIAYALREGLEHFEKKVHHAIPELRIAGGGSVSDEICQITADVFGRPVSRVQTHETASLGAAIAGFLAIGAYKTIDDAVKNMIDVKTTFAPNPQNVKIYDDLYKSVYLKIYPKIKSLYVGIKAFESRTH